MISLESIRGFFPEELRSGQFSKHILKEYVECLALEWISRSQWAPKLAFIGGTSLRLIKGIDRFSEDLDFDCKELSPDEFVRFTDALVAYLKNNGLDAVTKDKESGRLAAMRRSILFPGLLREMGLSAFKDIVNKLFRTMADVCEAFRFFRVFSGLIMNIRVHSCPFVVPFQQVRT